MRYSGPGSGRIFFPGSTARDMKKLFDSTLGSNAATVDWLNIPPGFAALLIIANARMTTSGTGTNMGMQFNGDTGTNYDTSFFASNSGSAPTSGASASNASLPITVCGSTADANEFGSVELRLQDYAVVGSYKQLIATYDRIPSHATPANSQVQAGVGQWHNTAAINRITFMDFNAGGNLFVAGSHFVCYGLP